MKNPSRSHSDGGKRQKRKKMATNPHLDKPGQKSSSKGVRLALHRFVENFLADAYNLVMPRLYKSIEDAAGKNEQVMHTDEVHYCQMIQFFMAFHRKKHKQACKKAAAAGEPLPTVDVAIVAATVRLQDVHYIKGLIMKYFNLFRTDNAGGALWSQRLHYAIRAMHELLVYLEMLHQSPDEEQKEFASSVMADLFYEAEFVETLPRIAKLFNPSKQSPGFARDVVLFNHLVLNLLKGLQQSTSFKLFMARKSKKKKKAAPPADGAAEGAAAAEPSLAAPGGDLDALFKEDGNAQPDEQDVSHGSEFEFDFDQFEERFADAKLIKMYTTVLKDYRSNSKELNHAVIKMYHRVYSPDKQDCRWIFYQLSVFLLFQTILNDPVTKADKKFSEVRGFVKAVVDSFFVDAEKYPPLFVEMLFWKQADDVREIALGPTKADQYRRKRSFKWTQQAEDKLRELYIEYHEDEDALAVITEKLQDAIEECSERNEASVRSKLRNMSLYLEPPAKWTKSELAELRELYESYVHAGDRNPLQTIVDDKVFPEKKNTVGKLRNQLKKMGVQVLSKGKSTAWTDDDVEVLQELHAEYKDVFTKISDIVDAVLDDTRLVGKTSGSVKAKLKELGLVKPASRPKRASRKEADDESDSAMSDGDSDAFEPENVQRRGGELDLDFVQSLEAAATSAKDKGVEALQQIAWLIDEMKECATSYDVGHRKGSHIGKTLRPLGDSYSIQPLVGMLGFIRELDSDSSSDSDSDDDDASKKKMVWEISPAVPGRRLREMCAVLQKICRPEAAEDGAPDDNIGDHGFTSTDEDEDVVAGDEGGPAAFGDEEDKEDEEATAAAAAAARKEAMKALAAKRGSKARPSGRAAPNRTAADDASEADVADTLSKPNSANVSPTEKRKGRRVWLDSDSDADSSSDSDVGEASAPTVAPSPNASVKTTKAAALLESDDSEDDDDAVAKSSQRPAAVPSKTNKRVLIDTDSEDSDSDVSQSGRVSKPSPPKKVRTDSDGHDAEESEDVGAWVGESEPLGSEAAVARGGSPGSHIPRVPEESVAQSEDVGAWAGETDTGVTSNTGVGKRPVLHDIESDDVGGWAGASETAAAETEATVPDTSMTSPSKRIRLDAEDSSE